MRLQAIAIPSSDQTKSLKQFLQGGAGAYLCRLSSVFGGFHLPAPGGKRRSAIVGALLLAMCCLPSAAQLQGSSQPIGDSLPVDCSDPVNAISSSCNSQPAQQPDAFGQGNSTAAGDPARSQRGGVNNQTYSDTGGLPRDGRPSRQAETPEPPEPLSEFQKFVAATTGEVLPVFGASLFGNAPSTFAPLDQGPVTADYLLGPGDELLIRVWGQINFNASLRIDRSGNIYLPQVGAVHVAGLPYASVQEHVRSEVARVFRNFNLTVDLGQLRSIQVFVVGQVRRPGSYTISSLSTLINALFASGGPSAQGSLRRIQLKRQGQLVSTFDLYDLLLRGDKSKDVPLLPGDVIFVPTVGPQVALTGSARHPAIYELGDANTLGQLLADAGGPTPLAFTARLSIERLEDNAGRVAMEVGFDQTALKMPLRDGDLLRILSVVPAYQKTVTLRGNTANPGRFAWRPGMRISALIPDRASLITRNYWWQRTRLGLSGAEFEPDVTGPIQSQPRYPVNLESFPCVMRTPDEDQPESSSMEATPDTPCTPYDRYNPNQLPQQYRYPSQPAIAQQAGRPAASGLSSSLGSQQAPQGESNLTLKAPRTDVKLSAPEIDWDYAVIERLDPGTLKTSLLTFNLGRLVLEHDQTQDLELKPGDVVSIFSQADIRVPIARQTRLVHLEGEFVSAGVYSVNPGETLRQLVIRAGGISPGAYLYGSEFTRESTRVLQQQRIHEYVRSLQLQITRGSIEQAASASSAQDVQQGNVAAASEQELIRRLDQVRATGRIVFDIDADASSVDVLPEIALEDGDRFIIPPRPSTVNVIGAVYDQNSFLYQDGSMVRDYLREAGGANRDADRKRAFVIRADGSVISRQSRRVSHFNTARVHPGDTIVVPEKTFRPGSIRTVLAYTQIFSQLAFGAAAINVLQ